MVKRCATPGCSSASGDVCTTAMHTDESYVMMTSWNKWTRNIEVPTPPDEVPTFPEQSGPAGKFNEQTRVARQPPLLCIKACSPPKCNFQMICNSLLCPQSHGAERFFPDESVTPGSCEYWTPELSSSVITERCVDVGTSRKVVGDVVWTGSGSRGARRKGAYLADDDVLA